MTTVRTGLGAIVHVERGTLTNPSSTPTTANREPIIITINGKRYRITQIQIKINGVWQDVDLAQFNLSKLAKRCQRIFEETDLSIPDDLSKLTFYFEKNDTSESLISRTLGKVSVLFKAQEKVGLELTKLEVQPKGSDQSQIIKLDEVLSKKEADLVKHHVGKIDKHTSQALNNPRFITKSKKRKSDTDLTTNPIHSSIQDAGADENRCAALSLAKRELSKLAPHEIVTKYTLTTPGLAQRINDAATPEAKIKLLADALIDKAATAITENDEFRNPHIKIVERKPCLAAIEQALSAYKEANRDYPGLPVGATPQQKTTEYVRLMRQPGFMLDLPFFLALEQPFIVIRKTHNNSIYSATEIGYHYVIRNSIETCDLDNVNIVYYDGLGHYKSVILTDDHQKVAIRDLIRRNINGQIEAFTTRLNGNLGNHEALRNESIDALALLHLYPRARQEIITRLKAQHPERLKNLENRLQVVSDDQFARALRSYIHSSPAPVVEEVD